MLNELSNQIHKNAKSKGFWENNNLPEKISLVHSEVSEALEADRKGKYANLKYFEERLLETEASFAGNYTKEDLDTNYKRVFESYMKDTFEDEVADSIIRLLDIAASIDMNIEKHIFYKMRYNAGRPNKHGKRY